MCPSVGAVMLAGCLCVILTGVSAASEPPVYKEVGGEVVLKPTSSDPITNIVWKDGPNIAIEWDGKEIEANRHFKERGNLNVLNGELTITGLIRNDSVLYTPEINGKIYSAIELIVISPVSTPTLSGSCNDEKTSCVLTCDGATAEAKPLAYIWNLGNSLSPSSMTNSVTVAKEDNSGIKEFSCELQNPVSKQSSQPIPNPFNASETKEGLRVNTGLTVFISLLTVVVLLGLIHRWKAGMWFFQKASMPWEADFWRKEGQPTDAAESNGTTAHFEKTQTDTDEVTPMT